ncbi:hypothetical protein [Nostoc sp.]|uniref:hypothetical protein n=1 Tax=Nostoc sp. TaxID=1180 RepID=UPI003592E8E4
MSESDAIVQIVNFIMSHFTHTPIRKLNRLFKLQIVSVIALTSLRIGATKKLGF